MLNVYHTDVSFEDIRASLKGPDFVDLSKIPSEEIADTADSIRSHHPEAIVFLGWIEGWMLDPKHEVRLRSLIRNHEVFCVTFFLDSLSYAWKCETRVIYTKTDEVISTGIDRNGDSQTFHDGCAVDDQSQTQHRSTSGETSDQRGNHQDRKARRSASGRKQSGPDSSSCKDRK